MSNQTHLLVIEDNPTRQSELSAVFALAKVNCTIIDSQQWKEFEQPVEPFSAIIVGGFQQQDERQLLFGSDNRKSGLSPIVDLIDREKVHNDEIESLSGVASLAWPFSTQELTNLLYQCQSSHHAKMNDREKQREKLLRNNMVGNSQAMEAVRKLIQQVAGSDASVLILGESGTGKEVAARNLHDLSQRKNKPFVPINCGAIPAELLESELFGHEKGAFTGALTARKGRFELAEGGTIFLDEIGDMPMPMQVKLLRVLQERTFEKVGSSTPISANVRIIAATHRKLAEEVEQNRFREDLFYRLNVFPIDMPPLRERVEDIPQLVSVLVARLEKENRGSVRLSPNALKSLMQCQWAGNVRELANLIERLCILYPYGVVDVRELPNDYCDEQAENSFEQPQAITEEPSFSPHTLQELPDEGIDLKSHIKNLEINFIEKALEQENWVVARAAKRLKMQRTTLVEKMRKYDLQKSES
jgi:sigma-54 dependent transcriptional regulator, flagellar regulatory protein